MVLREQQGPAARFVQRYSVTNVRQQLRRCAGVLLASSPLVDYFASHGLHSRLTLYPPVSGGAAPAAPRPASPRLHVAFYGGSHLHDFFLRTVVPAVRGVARERPVTLIAIGMTTAIPASDGLQVIQEPYDESYARGIDTLARYGVDVLMHPVAPGVGNNTFKNPHALISANALGAIPVVSTRAPYDGLQAEGVALFCDDSEESWRQALLQAADQHTATALRAGLAAFCSDRFSGRVNREVIDGILRQCAPPSRWSIPLRRSVISTVLLASRAARIFGRATRVMPGRKAVAG
jgi:hypothetical protein